MVLVVIVVVIIPRRGKLPTWMHYLLRILRWHVGVVGSDKLQLIINGTITTIIATIINGGGLDVTQAPEYWCI